MDLKHCGHDQKQGRQMGLRHRHQVFEWVVGQLLVQMRIDGPNGAVVIKQGVAISGRIGHHHRRNIARCTGLVVDHHTLVKAGFKLVRNSPGNHIGRATSSRAHDDFDGSVGEILSICRPRQHRAHVQQEQDDAQKGSRNGFH